MYIKISYVSTLCDFQCFIRWIMRFRSVKAEAEDKDTQNSRGLRGKMGFWLRKHVGAVGENGSGGWVFSPECSTAGCSQTGSQCVVSPRVGLTMFRVFLSLSFRPYSWFSDFFDIQSIALSRLTSLSFRAVEWLFVLSIKQLKSFMSAYVYLLSGIDFMVTLTVTFCNDVD